MSIETKLIRHLAPQPERAIFRMALVFAGPAEGGTPKERPCRVQVYKRAETKWVVETIAPFGMAQRDPESVMAVEGNAERVIEALMLLVEED